MMLRPILISECIGGPVDDGEGATDLQTAANDADGHADTHGLSHPTPVLQVGEGWRHVFQVSRVVLLPMRSVRDVGLLKLQRTENVRHMAEKPCNNACADTADSLLKVAVWYPRRSFGAVVRELVDAKTEDNFSSHSWHDPTEHATPQWLGILCIDSFQEARERCHRYAREERAERPIKSRIRLRQVFLGEQANLLEPIDVHDSRGNLDVHVREKAPRTPVRRSLIRLFIAER